MAVWLTTGFFEVKQARVDVAGSVYHNTFRCIPDRLPAPSAPGGRIVLAARTPLDVAIPPGPLLDRLQAAMKRQELLPYVEVRVLGGEASDVLRLDRVRVTGIAPLKTEMSRQVTLVPDL
jgi:hypothetical protein